ncbi:acyltransferase family protein [Thiorhodococcus fuscus]|uniref:Acyltransferase family protein n=1 Tax=Thiorhodococcus fuscus TaxID=527200 RepID=A0ABW4Y716_9GAMM
MDQSTIAKPDHGEPYVRLDFLDALRGFAAFYVILYHLALIPKPNLDIPEWLRFYTANGGTGVTLFFVLSAFALAYSLDARRGEPNASLHFYVRRFFRIAPLFYVMLVFYFFRDIAVYDKVHGADEILINASMLFNLWPDHMLGYVWASWTIGVEMLFYLMFPLIHHHVRGLVQGITLFFVFVLLAQAWGFFIGHYGVLLGYLSADRVATAEHHGLLSNLPNFMLGVLAYRIYFDHLVRLDPKMQRQVGAALIAAFVFLYTALLSGRLDGMLWDQLIWQGVCYSLLVLGLGLRPLSLLVNRQTVRLGKVSYSLYLLHPTIVFALAPVYYWLYQVLPNKTLAYGSSFIITASAVTALSLLTYRMVERRGIAWGEIVIGRWTKGREGCRGQDVGVTS